MINEPLISIITPTYNHERFIAKCINSVLAQSYQNWEQIIIDDGSTDSTEEIVTEYDDERIIYVKQKNKGIWKLHENYNKALKLSRGELIAVLEGDDFWPPSKLSKQLIAFENPEVVLSWGNAYIANKNGDIIEKHHKTVFNSNECIDGDLILKKLLFANFIPACTVICRKDALIKIGGFKQPEYYPTVDRPTWMQLSEEGKFYYLNEVLGYWRRYGDQITANKKLEMVAAHSAYSSYFFNKLPKSKKDKIGIRIEDIVNENKKKKSNIHFHLGRVALYEKNWEKSKKNFKFAFIYGNYSLKIKSIIGIIFSYIKLNFEGIANILNYPELKDLY